MSSLEDYEVETARHSVAKSNLTFLMDGIDPRDLSAEDGASPIPDFDESDFDEAGGVRETPTCQELAIEGESLTKQGEHKEAIPLLEAALQVGTDDRQLLSVLWSLLGNAHFYQGDYQKASLCHAHDLAICCELEDQKSQAQAYCNLGIANRKIGYLQRAKLCYQKYLEICERLDDSRSISKANHNLGDLHMTLGQLKLQRNGGKLEDCLEAKDHLMKAAEHFEKHLAYVQEKGSRASESRAHASLGSLYELLHDTDKAIDHHEQRLRISVELSNRAAEGRAYNCLGSCLRAIIQPDKALECFKRGLNIASELGDHVGIGIAHSNLGTTFEILNDFQEALMHHEQHLEKMKEVGNLHGEAMALSNVAKSSEYLANMGKACEALESLAEIQKKLKEEEKLANTLRELARLSGHSDELPSVVREKKSGGGGIKQTWKKLREKRAKKRSITGPEFPISISEIMGTKRQTGSPAIPEEGAEEELKKTSDSKEKLHAIKKSKEPKKKAIGNKEDVKPPAQPDMPTSLDESVKTGSAEVKTYGEPSVVNNPCKSKKEAVAEVSLPESLSNPKLSQSASFSSSSNTQGSDSQAPGFPIQANGYVINGPSPMAQEHKLDLTSSAAVTSLYACFGGEKHRQILGTIQEFLESSGEFEPVDLSVLQEWDGWTIASSEIIIQSTKESKLI